MMVGWIDKSNITPPDWIDYIILSPVTIFAAFFMSSFFEWLPGIDSDSAKWALSTQTQSTATILGLLVAAVVFRLHLLKAEENLLRDEVNSYLLELSKSQDISKPGQEKLNMIYDEYYVWVRNEISKKGKKKEIRTKLATLGRLWVIKELASNYSCSAYPSRLLKRGQAKPLYSLNEFAGLSAVKMWEHYFTQPADFMLEVFDTVSTICPFRLSVEKILRKDMVGISWKLRGERLSRVRKGILRPFYPTCIILFFAILIGMLGVIGVNNPETIKFLGDYAVRWLVGLPVVLSAFGLVYSLATILRIVR
jgi:hypothetical protein